MFKRILVPLDGSRFSSTALKYAVDVAQRYSADIILAQVVVRATPAVIPATPEGAMSTAVLESAVEAARLEDTRNTVKAKRYLQRKGREVTEKRLECSYRVQKGDPARTILELCRKEGADLVVMASHGKGGLKRAFMGSVSDEVVRQSRVPVLIVRPAR